MTVFSIKLQNCRQQLKFTFLDLFIIAKIIALTYPLNACSRTKGSKVKINLRRKTMEAYCVKCKAKIEMKDPKEITMKNGRPATQGVCPTCGTKMFRIGKSK